MYQVWIKDDYGETYTRGECEDLAAAQAEVLAAIKRGATPILTLEIPYDVSIKVKEAKTVEAKKSETEQHKVARAESDRKVRRGDPGPAQPVDKGSGHPGAGPGAGD